MGFSNEKKSSTRRIAIFGLLTAILLIQNFVPFLGNIPIPPLNPTIIHITVIVATLTLGTVDGMILGGIWGIIRVIRAVTVPATPLDPIIWVNPVISIVPRVLIGLFAGLVYTSLKKTIPNKSRLNMVISSVVGSLTNTVFVLLFIYLFFSQPVSGAMNIDPSNLGAALLVIVGTGGVPEAILAGLIAPLITKPLQKIYRVK